MPRPRPSSIEHALFVAKVHGTDARFTIPRSKRAELATGRKRKWVECTCDICSSVRRWVEGRRTAPFPRGAG